MADLVLIADEIMKATTTTDFDANYITGELKKFNKLGFSHFKEHMPTILPASYTCLESFPFTILKILCVSLIVHDAILESFITSINILIALENYTVSIASKLLEYIRTAITELDLSVMLNINRMELFTGCVRNVFDFAVATNLNLNEDALMSTKSLVDSQLNLKEAISNCKVEKQTMKSMKESCSEVRDTAIEAVRSIIVSCPSLIHSNYEYFWELCLKVFCSSKLFHTGYIILESQPIDMVSESVKIDYNYRAFNYLMTALTNYQRYSLSAALELIQTLENLCDAKFVLLRDQEHSFQFLSVVNAAYKGFPKLSSKDTEVYLWKVGLNVLLSKYFSSLQHFPVVSPTLLDSGVLDDWVPQTVVSFIFLKQFLRVPQQQLSRTQTSETASSPPTEAVVGPYATLVAIYQKTTVKGLLLSRETEAATEVLSSTIEALTKFFEYVIASRSVLSPMSRAGEAVLGLLDYSSRELSNVSEVVFDDDAVRVCQEIALLGAVTAAVLTVPFPADRRQAVQVLVLAGIRCLHSRLSGKEQVGSFDEVVREVTQEALQALKDDLSALVTEARGESAGGGDDGLMTGFIQKVLPKVSSYLQS